MDGHPGRPFEPRQVDDLRIGRPVSPMRDHEFPPHPVPAPREQNAGSGPNFHIISEMNRVRQIMPVKLNRIAFNHAKQLIKEGKSVADDRNAWSEH
jgi:hypothetical protein